MIKFVICECVSGFPFAWFNVYDSFEQCELDLFSCSRFQGNISLSKVASGYYFVMRNNDVIGHIAIQSVYYEN